MVLSHLCDLTSWKWHLGLQSVGTFRTDFILTQRSWSLGIHHRCLDSVASAKRLRHLSCGYTFSGTAFVLNKGPLHSLLYLQSPIVQHWVWWDVNRFNTYLQKIFVIKHGHMFLIRDEFWTFIFLICDLSFSFFKLCITKDIIFH